MIKWIKNFMAWHRLIFIEEPRARAEWYRNEIIQALEKGDYKGVFRLERERDRC